MPDGASQGQRDHGEYVFIILLLILNAYATEIPIMLKSDLMNTTLEHSLSFYSLATVVILLNH